MLVYVCPQDLIDRWILTDVDITKSSQALAELLNSGLISLSLVSILVLSAALLLNMEAQVLKQNNGTILSLVHDLLNLRADTVRGEGNLLASKLLLEFRDNRLEGVLLVDGTVGATEVGHEDDGLGAIVEGVLDRRDGADDALVVGDGGAIERDVEVDLLRGVSGVIGSQHQHTMSALGI